MFTRLGRNATWQHLFWSVIYECFIIQISHNECIRPGEATNSCFDGNNDGWKRAMITLYSVNYSTRWKREKKKRVWDTLAPNRAFVTLLPGSLFLSLKSADRIWVSRRAITSDEIGRLDAGEPSEKT